MLPPSNASNGSSFWVVAEPDHNPRHDLWARTEAVPFAVVDGRFGYSEQLTELFLRQPLIQALLADVVADGPKLLRVESLRCLCGNCQTTIGPRRGEEAVDPPSITDPRCGGYPCRYSDAALIQHYSPSASWEKGFIAQTVSSGHYGGSIDLADPGFMQIVAVSGYVYVGEVLDKMGQTTGWAYGRVESQVYADASCPDHTLYPEYRPAYRVLCQGVLESNIQDGDSGGPVFKFHYGGGGGNDGATFYGIQIGGAGPQSQFTLGEVYFSPVSGIDRDLGFIGY